MQTFFRTSQPPPSFESIPTTPGHQPGHQHVHQHVHQPVHHVQQGQLKTGPFEPYTAAYPQTIKSGFKRHRVLRFWIWEIVSLLITVGLMGAIIGLLIKYDGKYASEWKPSMNLSTLVALLSTILRASMVVVVAEILSQIKWSWFMERSRPLSHLQDFDSASRGYFGSMRLMFLVLIRGITVPGLLALVAALIIVVSFAVGPFMQQAIRQDICPKIDPEVNASIPVSSYVLGEYFRVAAGMWEASIDMKGTMLAALTNPLNNDLGIRPFCPTGNCTFPDYGTGVTHASIGICSKCRDSTAEVKGPNKDGNITLQLYPNYPRNSSAYNSTIFLNFDSGLPFLSLGWASLWGERNFSVQGLETSGLHSAWGDVKILTGTNSPCANNSGTLVCPHQPNPVTLETIPYGNVADFIATSCTLYPCLKEYHGSVHNGVFEEHVVSTTPATGNIQSVGGDTNYTAVRSPCVIDDSGTWYTFENMSMVPNITGRRWTEVDVSWEVGELDSKNVTLPAACLYELSPVYGRAMSTFIASLFSGACRYDTRQGAELWCGEKWWMSSLFGDGNATFESINKSMDAFATAITNKFRVTGFGPEEPRAAGQMFGTGYGVKGIVTQMSICNYVEWEWLLMPSILVALSTILLVWVIVRSYLSPNEPVWKANIMPLLFYGIREQSSAPAQRPADMMDLSDINTETSKIKVRLVRGEKEAGFVDESQLRGRGDGDSGYSMDSLIQDGQQQVR